MPVIPALFLVSNKSAMCLLMLQELDNDKTRVWFLKCMGPENQQYYASICVYSAGDAYARDDFSIEGDAVCWAI